VSKKPKQRLAPVVHLSEVMASRKLSTYQDKISDVIDSNRRAIGQLYSTGALFSRTGCRAGRDLLLAHQHLLKVMTLLERLADRGDVPAPKNADAVYRELDSLLDRTSELTVRTGQYLSRLQRE
jgi:hypothetical protein